MEGIEKILTVKKRRLKLKRHLTHISADMIEEILLRLPVKSLLRFKRVCKSWCALIQSRSFIHRHYCHDNNQERLVFKMGEYVEGRFEESDYNPLWLDYFGKDTHRRIGPVIGILCQISVSGEIVLLNPATHKVKRVPPLPPGVPCDSEQFKLSCWLYSFGFGIESSGDYKIVVIDTGATAAAFGWAWVYNSISDCWKPIEGVLSRLIKNKHEYEAKFLNGVYYWVLVSRDGLGAMLAFDMMSEKFREYEFPHGINAPAIGAYRDSIAVMSWDKEFVVWAMVKPGIWSKCCRLRNTPDRLIRLCLWKGEAFFWNPKHRNLVVADVTTERVRIKKKIRIVVDIDSLCRGHFFYKESLLSIKGEQVAMMYISNTTSPTRERPKRVARMYISNTTSPTRERPKRVRRLPPKLDGCVLL